MRAREKIVDLAYRIRDLGRILSPDDPFGTPDHVGGHFEDARRYYLDFRPTASWPAKSRNGIPLIFIPSLGRYLELPITIIHFGLGSVDRFLETGDPRYQSQVESVASWMSRMIRPDGSFEYYPRVLDSSRKRSYYSANSGMGQGQAISFLVRAIDHQILSRPEDHVPLVGRILDNMLLSVEEGGTVWQGPHGPVLLETCRTDHHIVLNGWIFGLLGLFDVQKRYGPVVEEFLATSVKALQHTAPGFVVERSGWSYYDSDRRRASLTYHATHTNLMDVMHRLTGVSEFRELHERFAAADSRKGRFLNMARKVPEKFVDDYRYATDRPWPPGFLGRTLFRLVPPQEGVIGVEGMTENGVKSAA